MNWTIYLCESLCRRATRCRSKRSQLSSRPPPPFNAFGWLNWRTATTATCSTQLIIGFIWFYSFYLRLEWEKNIDSCWRRPAEEKNKRETDNVTKWNEQRRRTWGSCVTVASVLLFVSISCNYDKHDINGDRLRATPNGAINPWASIHPSKAAREGHRCTITSTHSTRLTMTWLLGSFILLQIN